jgi:hypothetical protein
MTNDLQKNSNQNHLDPYEYQKLLVTTQTNDSKFEDLRLRFEKEQEHLLSKGKMDPREEEVH